MKNKTLQVADNLQERIPYSSRFPALSICSDHFDDYFQREWGCHWHDEFEFAVVREGVAAFTVYDGQRNETVELSPGMVSLPPPAILQCKWDEIPYCSRWFCFACQLL